MHTLTQPRLPFVTGGGASSVTSVDGGGLPGLSLHPPARPATAPGPIASAASTAVSSAAGLMTAETRARHASLSGAAARRHPPGPALHGQNNNASPIGQRPISAAAANAAAVAAAGAGAPAVVASASGHGTEPASVTTSASGSPLTRLLIRCGMACVCVCIRVNPRLELGVGVGVGVEVRTKVRVNLIG